MEKRVNQCKACVVAVTSNNEVWVEVPARLAVCDHCPNPAGCHTSLLGQVNQPRRFLMRNTLNLRVGDRVNMAIAEGMIFRAVLASYGIPLLLVISGAVVGQSLAGDGAAALGGAVGLALGFLLLRQYGKYFHKKHHSVQCLFSPQELRRENNSL